VDLCPSNGSTPVEQVCQPARRLSGSATKQLFDPFVDVPHSQLAPSLLENHDDCVADGAKLTLAVRCDAAGKRVLAMGSPPVPSRETLIESRQIVV
jgi:hypothetical protein